ncbi:MAG TPA: Shedu anti-phage system protein SduA domain-containing protein [Pseudonocardiaceae bacterium]|nr:Shedu anti-phage system protein SduA domain-containing protein [Pseudonocardiaceae bacterium]
MTAQVSPETPGDFREPFVGHLPDYRAETERAAPGPPSESRYNDLLMDRWRALLDSEESRGEALVHTFLERHPSLLPGPYSVDGESGHSPFPMAVISKPKLPGLSDREPDFMWIATDSGSVYPILIEIETPHKRWFYGERAEIHSDLTHAQGQLAEWRAWFKRGHNRTAFLDHYEVPTYIANRTLEPRYVLIYGRRNNFLNDRRRQEKRAELARADERLMSFDRLAPTKRSSAYSCVRKNQQGYQALAVPPSLTIINDGDDYQHVTGWAEALDNCPDMADGRRDYLKHELELLTENPNAYANTKGNLRWRRPEWL